MTKTRSARPGRRPDPAPGDARRRRAAGGVQRRDPPRSRHSGGPDEPVAAWTRDLFRGDHPTFTLEDFTIVEDTRSGAIVSSLNLISQTWTYGGIPFGVGRPELVGTHPDYRRRGLVRAQFEVIHGWSAERGDLVQAITGIPWYYRQFGYEMALDLSGGRAGYAPQVPKLKEGEPEPYPIRPATEADLPFIAQLYDESVKRSRVTCVLDLELWRYELRMSPTKRPAPGVGRDRDAGGRAGRVYGLSGPVVGDHAVAHLVRAQARRVVAGGDPRRHPLSVGRRPGARRPRRQGARVVRLLAEPRSPRLPRRRRPAAAAPGRPTAGRYACPTCPAFCGI